MLACACNPSTWEIEAKVLHVKDQPRIHRKILFQKIKTKTFQSTNNQKSNLSKNGLFLKVNIGNKMIMISEE
jgi:hypothetical protein